MKRVLLLLLIGCGRDPQPEHVDLDLRIEENWRHIERTQREIDALVLDQTISEVEERVTAVVKMIRCVNGALDARGLDRDQLLTIEGCMQEAGYRE